VKQGKIPRLLELTGFILRRAHIKHQAYQIETSRHIGISRSPPSFYIPEDSAIQFPVPYKAQPGRTLLSQAEMQARCRHQGPHPGYDQRNERRSRAAHGPLVQRELSRCLAALTPRDRGGRRVYLLARRYKEEREVVDISRFVRHSISGALHAVKMKEL
jgi:hypothetical protein